MDEAALFYHLYGTTNPVIKPTHLRHRNFDYVQEIDDAFYWPAGFVWT